MKIFAEKLSMSASSLQTYLNGESLPGSPIIAKLIEYGCNINWLLNGAGEMHSVGSVMEPTEGIYMNHSALLTENEALKKRIEKFKVEVYDLQDEKKELLRHIAKMQDDYDDLEKELFNLKTELDKHINISTVYKMEKGKTG